MFKPVQKKSVSDSVFEQLRDQIVSGAMEPGESLPSERVLSEMLQVNRGAVREALKRLSQARLVSIQHGGGTRVLDFQKTAGTELLAEMLVNPFTQGLNQEVAVSVMEMRSALGADMARRCSQRSPEVHGQLMEIVEDMRSSGDLMELRELDMAFWEVVVEGSRNVAYQLTFNSIRDIYEKLGELLVVVFADELNDTEVHTKLAEAIRDQESDDAEFFARDLMSRGEEKTRSIAEALTKQ